MDTLFIILFIYFRTTLVMILPISSQSKQYCQISFIKALINGQMLEGLTNHILCNAKIPITSRQQFNFICIAK